VTYDVLITGAGPVGLFLACELRLAGLTVLILESSNDLHSPMKRLPFGMRGLNAPTIEAFYRRGMLDSIRMPEHSRDGSGKSIADSAHWQQQQQRRSAGHFAGIQFFQDRIDDSWPYRLIFRTWLSSTYDPDATGPAGAAGRCLSSGYSNRTTGKREKPA